MNAFYISLLTMKSSIAFGTVYSTVYDSFSCLLPAPVGEAGKTQKPVFSSALRLVTIGKSGGNK
jgi:hypothetical protein